MSTIAIVAGIVIGGTIAYFSDTETSNGNIFTAGSIDLKVDHLAQTYNDADCKTCNVLLISDPTNMVVAKNGVSFATPYPAVYLSPTHPAWTAQNDSELSAANARWIWEQNPVKQEDTVVDTTYTFRKTFEWYGPIVSTDLSMAVGHDNTVEVWLNGINIGNGTDIYGFQIEHMLHIPAVNITNNVLQGQNVLEIKLRNRAEPNGNPDNNPAGLIYKFEINGNCGEDYFKGNCTLFGEKDLTPADHFWMFDDIKPGDRGTNVISLHVDSNDAYVCMINDVVADEENGVVEAEGADTEPTGELSGYLKLFIWNDDGNGTYEPAGEASLYEGVFTPAEISRLSLPTGGTDYLGVAWCMGNQTVDHINGTISCDGTGDQNNAQTDKLTADLFFYAIQQRNNGDFSCDTL